MTIRVSGASESWQPTALFCCYCGRAGVWMCTDRVDVWDGQPHACTGCGKVFLLPSLHASAPHDAARIEALRQHHRAS